MLDSSTIGRLSDMVQAMERLQSLIESVTIAEFGHDWQRQWLVERGVEIISDASRHLPNALKARHPTIPWRKVAGIGNILRHNYESIAAPVMWALVREDLPPLEKVCRAELARAQGGLAGR
jgi:uncharacterized protein with HEPN domain